MSTFRVDEKYRPEVHYVKSVLDPTGRSDFRLVMLENQMVCSDKDAGLFEKVDPLLKVSANKTDRSRYPLGTIFEIKSCVTVSNSSKKWYQSSDRTYLRSVDEDDAIDAIDKIMKDYEDSLLSPSSEEEDPEITEVDFEEREVSPEPAEEKDPDELTYLQHLAAIHPCPTVAKTGFYVDKNVWLQLIRHMDRGKNIMLTGDSGVGKTELCSLLSETFKKEIKIHDMGATQDPIASLIGVHRIGKDGKSVFDQAKFISDIQGNNVVLMDEVNRAPLNANNILFPLLDRRRRIDMSIASSDVEREVEAHENAVFIGTANIGSQYTGTAVLDEAFTNRFIRIPLGYPPPSVEAKLLMKRATDLDKDMADKIVKVANAVRSKHQNEEMSSTISIRQTIELGEMVADGFELKDALTYYLKPLFGEEFSEVHDILQSL